MIRRPATRQLSTFAIALVVAGCVAQPPEPTRAPAPLSSPRPGATDAPAPAESQEPLPDSTRAGDWHPATVLPPDRATFQRNAGPLAAARTVWQITGDGSFLPAEAIGAVQRVAVIQGANGYVDWDSPGIVRWSPDGLTWRDDPSGPIAANLSMVARVGDRLLLVGQSTGARVGAWLSDDGRSWSEALGAPGDLRSAVERPGRGIVAAGGSGPSTEVWSSSDGSVWQKVDAPHPIAGDPSLLGVGATRGRVVAIGAVDGRAAAWWSADLRSWTEAGAAWGRDALLESVTNIGDTFFIAGRRSDRPAVWVSSDGAAWSAVDLPFEAGLEGEAVLVTGEIHRQPIAFGYTTHDEGNGGWSRTADRIWVLGRWPSG